MLLDTFSSCSSFGFCFGFSISFLVSSSFLQNFSLYPLMTVMHSAATLYLSFTRTVISVRSYTVNYSFRPPLVFHVFSCRRTIYVYRCSSGTGLYRCSILESRACIPHSFVASDDERWLNDGVANNDSESDTLTWTPCLSVPTSVF